MVQQPFKKDSRVWLHKNSKRKHPGTELTRVYRNSSYRQDAGFAFEEEGWDNSPYITGADGKVYKKDSRTWLHKSSNKAEMRDVRNDAVRELRPSKNPRRMWDIMKKELISKRAQLAPSPPANVQDVQTQDSKELIRGMANTGKRKKNNTRIGRGYGVSLSHRDVHIIEEETAFNSHSSDKRPRFRFVRGSYSDQDNIYDDSSSDTDNNDDDDDVVLPTRYAVLNCNECDSLPLCRSNASIELSQEGINVVREIATQMHFRNSRRSVSLLENQELSVMQDHNPLDLTTGGLFSSRSSLNTCGVNLSDECVTAYEEVPGDESDYQLSEATQGLNVKSPIYNPSLTPVDGENDAKIVID